MAAVCPSCNRGTLEPGTHSFAWDGRDARGVRLGPGLYIYQLSMAGERVSRRLIMTH